MHYIVMHGAGLHDKGLRDMGAHRESLHDAEVTCRAMDNNLKASCGE